ncbi:30S ribosomal protein S27ae [Candidatus Woesearchaeota archaeon]|nr:30S ribosomal protein S27ae [Candidatus Woesearchaeota archaeon]
MAEEKKEAKKTEQKQPKKPKKSLYKIEGDKIIRTNPHCPKCGTGYFLAVHEKRKHCGNCAYTEFVK